MTNTRWFRGEWDAGGWACSRTIPTPNRSMTMRAMWDANAVWLIAGAAVLILLIVIIFRTNRRATVERRKPGNADKLKR